jgi:GGDEF domain-containing protein
VARLGGDEFAILLPVSGWEEALAATQRVDAALHDPFSMYGITLDVDASIGIALAEPGDDVETLLRHADVAMYEAKAAHHTFARYEASRDDNDPEHRRLRHRLLIHVLPQDLAGQRAEDRPYLRNGHGKRPR